MTGNQLWGPEDDVPELITDDSDEEEAALNRQPRPPRPDAEALLTLGVRAGRSVSHRPLYHFATCIASWHVRKLVVNFWYLSAYIALLAIC